MIRTRSKVSVIDFYVAPPHDTDTGGALVCRQTEAALPPRARAGAHACVTWRATASSGNLGAARKCDSLA